MKATHYGNPDRIRWMNSLMPILRQWMSVALPVFLFLTLANAGRAAEDAKILWSVDGSADGKFLAAGGAWVTIVNGETGMKLEAPELEGMRAVAKVRWHPDGKRIVTSSHAGHVTLWSPDAKPIRTLDASPNSGRQRNHQ